MAGRGRILTYAAAAAAGIGVPLTRRIRQGLAAGLRLRLDGATRAMLAGRYEEPVQMALAERLRPGDGFVDVGANVGFFALLAGRAVGPDGWVLAVEPVPANAARIRANAALNRLPRVTVVEAAAGAVDGAGELELARHNGGGALSSAPVPPDACGRITVPVVTVDTLLAGSRLPPPTLVKIDVEGSEAEALNGMRGTIARHHPAILFEVDAPTREDAERRFAELAAMLAAQGYGVDTLPDAYPAGDWTVLHGLAVVSATGGEGGR